MANYTVSKETQISKGMKIRYASSIMKKEHVNLTEADCIHLENITQKGSTTAKMYKRSLALLELNRGKTFTEVAQVVGVTKQTASTWAEKYRQSGLAFLTDKPRSGRPNTIDSVDRAKVTALACSQPPQGYKRWSLRLLAEKAVELEEVEAISYSEVRRTLKKTNLSLISSDNGSSPK